MSDKQRLGIYAGTFDPIHPGHVAFATQAMRDCELDSVVFLPEPKPRGKQNVTSMSHRLNLITLATQNEPNFSVLKLTSPHFTVVGTLPKLQQEFEDAHLTFLMGSDVAKSLHYWRGVKSLLQGASIAIGLRDNDDPVEITTAMELLGHGQGMPVQYTLVSAPHADMSSSGIRNGITNMAHLPASVLTYMQQHELYTPASPETA